MIMSDYRRICLQREERTAQTIEIEIIIQGYHAQQNQVISYVDESHVTIEVQRLSQ